MKDKLLFITAIVTLITSVILLYSIFAGIWGFNPTNIELFNVKLGAIAFVLDFLSATIVYHNT